MVRVRSKLVRARKDLRCGKCGGAVNRRLKRCKRCSKVLAKN